MSAARTRLYISPVAFHAQISITNPDYTASPDFGLNSPILRIPEFVRGGVDKRPPGYTEWETIRPETELRYRWAPPEEMKREYGTEFHGHVKVEGDEVLFEVVNKNIGDKEAPGGVYLFCLQGGTTREFHDYDGCNTFIWIRDRFVSVHEFLGGRFPDHRMMGVKCAAGGEESDCATRKLMVKRSTSGFILAIALDRCAHLSGNFNLWPSCIHANPDWGTLQPGEQAVARGRVYFFKGALEDVKARYLRDFGA